MTLNEARIAVYEHFLSEWADRTPATLDNELFTPPGNEAAEPRWVRVTVRHLLGEQETLGPVNGRRFRRRARCFAQVFIPRDEGTSRSDELAQEVKNILEGKRLGDVVMGAATTREIGEDERWWRQDVEIDLTYDETK